MRIKMKRMGAMLLACVMLWGISAGVNASENPEPTESPEPPKHVCEFSYMGMKYLGATHVTYHTYVDSVGSTRTCEVIADQYCDVYGCTCGETVYRNKHGVVRHTAKCGQ